jgi:hypothetical protein
MSQEKYSKEGSATPHSRNGIQDRLLFFALLALLAYRIEIEMTFNDTNNTKVF